MKKASYDWQNLDFSYRRTDWNIRYHWRDGQWSEGQLTAEETIPLHMAATAVHYGQAAFEGLKVFESIDGDALVFRMEENARRLRYSCRKIMMAELPEGLFEEAVTRVVNANRRFIPPHGTGASLYVRPLLIGTGPRVGVKPADEYMFIVMVMPVGPYFKTGFQPVHLVVEGEVDRAAPLGVGDAKVAGNYAAGMRASMGAKARGFTEVLYLDAKHKKYIDESGPANFYGIRDGQYITPHSDSILPSITNKSLVTLADDMGLETVRRPVEMEEIFTFSEAGCCGTAAVITPVGTITWGDRKMDYGPEPGPWSTKLYNRLQAIQTGDEPDPWGWVRRIQPE